MGAVEHGLDSRAGQLDDQTVVSELFRQVGAILLGAQEGGASRQEKYSTEAVDQFGGDGEYAAALRPVNHQAGGVRVDISFTAVARPNEQGPAIPGYDVRP
ncbi:hypothetical protein AB0A77_31905 [Streptomyces varsoviensis]|uniref:hypothetical protein n=1 Tax=Streptomyces varsoviensis TaxID=67373 RepID=UPI0033D04616